MMKNNPMSLKEIKEKNIDSGKRRDKFNENKISKE